MRVRTVRQTGAADFSGPPFWGGKNLRVAKIFYSSALKLFHITQVHLMQLKLIVFHKQLQCLYSQY